MPRLSVNINDECAYALLALGNRHDVNVTELIRRAISVYKYLDDATQRGERLWLESKYESTELKLI